MLRHRVGSTWLRGCAGSRCGAVGLAGVSTPDAMTIMFTPDGATAPPAAAQLIREHLTHRPNMNTINATSLWLFPGIRAGQPLTADRMSNNFAASASHSGEHASRLSANSSPTCPRQSSHAPSASTPPPPNTTPPSPAHPGAPTPRPGLPLKCAPEPTISHHPNTQGRQ